MGSLNDLLKKTIKKNNEAIKSEAKANVPEAVSVNENKPNISSEIKKPFSLKLGVTKPSFQVIDDPVKEMVIETNLPKHPIEHSTEHSTDPFASLSDALDSIDLETTKDDQQSKSVTTNQQFKNPTLSDVEKFVFEEQPDISSQEIISTFSQMLDDLQTATGDQIPYNLANNLKFIKEHSFLADILKPESISILVKSMRKSYGYVVSNKTEKQAKKAKNNEKLSGVLDSLGDFSF